ncbi:MAG TPA: hypothetical protein VK203_02420 [Nostocaceae cyanobacterium]|nr:hypothetical protein [Nostocaceae cyanobacterium]
MTNQDIDIWLQQAQGLWQWLQNFVGENKVIVFGSGFSVNVFQLQLTVQIRTIYHNFSILYSNPK